MTDVTVNATLEAQSGFPTAEAMDVTAMQHRTLDPATLTSDTIQSVSIVSQPSIGRVILQDNDTIVVNMKTSGFITGNTSFTFRVTIGGQDTDCVMDVSILEAEQQYGWGACNHYFHPINDTTGHWDIIPGDGYLEFWGDAASTWTVANIASDAGVSQGTVTSGTWLIDNRATYGSEAQPLAVDALSELHQQLNDRWHGRINLKKGGDYSSLQTEFGRRGKSAMYPAVLSSYGTGERPIAPSGTRNSNQSGYTLQEDLKLPIPGRYKFNSSGACSALNMVTGGQREWLMDNVPCATIMNCKVMDATLGPPGGAGTWDPFDDRVSGIFMTDCDGAYVRENFFDRNGFGQGYNVNANLNDPLPPGVFSHNAYFQANMFDVVCIGNINTRPSSIGLQFRSGGIDIYNVSYSCAFGSSHLGTGSPGKTQGLSVFGISYRHIVTQGRAHSPSMLTADGDGGVYSGGQVGKTDAGYNFSSEGGSAWQTAVLHFNNPNDPSDTRTTSQWGIARDTSLRGGLRPGSTWMINGWTSGSGTDKLATNDGSITQATLDTYTIQRWADGYLSRTVGTTTDIDDLTNEFRNNVDDFRGIAEDINNYFIDGINAAGNTDFARATPRTVAQTVKAQAEPNGLTPLMGDYVPLDFDTGDYPGFISGDSFDLQGHIMRGAITKARTINNLILGDGGSWVITSSYVNITGTVTGTGTIGTTVSGRLAFDGYSDSGTLDVVSNGGLTVNLGSVSDNVNFTLTVQDWNFVGLDNFPYNEAHMLICTSGETVTIGNGHKLSISGHSNCSFDGPSGTGTLNAASGGVLEFLPGGGGANTSVELGVLDKRQTGQFGDLAPALTAVVDLTNFTVNVDVTGVVAGTYDIIDVDTITGSPTPTITGGSATHAYSTGKLTITVS